MPTTGICNFTSHSKDPISEIEHREYLTDPSQDPRIRFIEQLIEDCGSSGDILVYNIGF